MQGRTSAHAARVFHGCQSPSNKKARSECDKIGQTSTYLLVSSVAATAYVIIDVMFRASTKWAMFLVVILALYLTLSVFTIGWIKIAGRTSCFPKTWKVGKKFPKDASKCLDQTRMGDIIKDGIKAVIKRKTYAGRAGTATFAVVISLSAVMLFIACYKFKHIAGELCSCFEGSRKQPRTKKRNNRTYRALGDPRTDKKTLPLQNSDATSSAQQQPPPRKHSWLHKAASALQRVFGVNGSSSSSSPNSQARDVEKSANDDSTELGVLFHSAEPAPPASNASAGAAAMSPASPQSLLSTDTPRTSNGDASG